MKITLYYEDKSHPTVLEVPDEECTVMVEKDYQQRLAGVEDKENIIAIIGDGSMSGGEALEGLDTAGEMKSNLIIVFNDNDQSIAEVHGGMYKGFKELRDTNGKSERNLFKAMGLDYRFVADGNDTEALIVAFEEVKDIDHPVVVHIVTQKGKGYKFAEENKEDWHWHMPFDIETGEVKQPMIDPYAEQTAETFLRLAKEDKKFIAISAATPASMGLTQARRKELGEHYIDVGIAEEQAVAMASGLAKNGAHPVFGDYSSFFQRTYDQLAQDVCVNNSPATFLVFWASMYGMNDVTHLGFYDIPMMSNIPNLVYLAPTSPEEYQAMLDWAVPQDKYPVGIRVPHMMVPSSNRSVRKDYDELNKYEMVQQGSHVAILGLGSFYNLAEETAAKLKEQGIEAIGDGSMSGGEALEGLDTAGEMDSNLIIIFNDNDMSIAEVHGGMYKGFKELRDTNGKSERNLFKAMGLDYRFVADGNDAEALIAAFKEVKDIDHPVVLHIVTQKGKGYKIAEENKEDWHWHMPFDIETGEVKQPVVDPYAEQTAETFLRLAKEDKKFIAISAATPSSMGLTQERRKELGEHYIDVGIAEEQAVAMASGLARNGAHPVFGDFSSFFQRTYDQLSQDVCVNNSSATFLVFWASMYGMNDVTHLGFYDIPMMSNIPNLVYLAPTSPEEYQAMLDWAIPQEKYPVAIRVPHMMVGSSNRPVRKSYDELNKYEVVKEGSRVAIIGLGNFYNLAEDAAAKLKEQGIDATLINPIFISGQDKDLLEKLKANHELVVTLEDGVLDGGFGEKIARFYGADKMISTVGSVL
ncbi:1-deoxy-D-xylulose-5-phosphate synthase [Selenomonas sp. AE3005]|uniref:1-deoxy-D-xylulose-5-phosphate synthase n=1 Tax=Selenomonas sp. AE3005 TaxID=1485543 RepID=UPI001E5E0C4D|nr:1-deoxy-D-xylulose-5-phosphate synthase [Selenomonas sp. AE3005]